MKLPVFMVNKTYYLILIFVMCGKLNWPPVSFLSINIYISTL